MGKKALISRHVVITDSELASSRPIFAVILIEDDLIQDVIAIDGSSSLESVLESYRDWNPEDFSDFYISPGLVDLNCRAEFEDYSQLTQSAISGGVTFLLEEQSFYGQPAESALFSNIASVKTIGSVSDLSDISQPDIFALKAYMYQPARSVPKISSKLTDLFSAVSSLGLPLMIDPTIPNHRMHYLSSPLRFESLEDRLTANPQDTKFFLFAGAYDEDAKDSGSEQETQDVKLKGSWDDSEMRKASTVELELSQLKLKSKMSLSEVYSSPKNLKRDIYEDLNKRIEAEGKNIEALVQVERKSFDHAGAYLYNPGNAQKSQPEVHENPFAPENNAPRKKRRPPPISTTPKEQIDHQMMYDCHLANNPDFWEINGVSKVLKNLGNLPCKLHICNISSAKALNDIRKAKERNEGITCEIPSSVLFFDSKEIENGDTRFKNHVTIRNHVNCNLLWELLMLKYKGIDAVSSQHASIDKQYKFVKGGKFPFAINGINSMGFTLQAVWSKINGPISDRHKLERLIVRMAQWMSFKPAQVLGISHKTGSICKGKTADLVIWQPYEPLKVRQVYSGNQEMSPFLGRTLLGRIHTVYLHGEVAFCNGEFHPCGRRLTNSFKC